MCTSFMAEGNGKSSRESGVEVSNCSAHEHEKSSTLFQHCDGVKRKLSHNLVQRGRSEKAQSEPLQRLNLLPRLVDDQCLLCVAPCHERTSLVSRSMEILPCRNLISQHLRTRTISLPNLDKQLPCQDKPCPPGKCSKDIHVVETKKSCAADGCSDEESKPVEIDPFPNVGVESYLSSHQLPDFIPSCLKPSSPEIRCTRHQKRQKNEISETSRKKLEALMAKERKRNVQAKSRHTGRRSTRSKALARKQESEAAKQHPIRKQFVYSELVQAELQKRTPKRLPGGKLKPIYNRRTLDGDIDIPAELYIPFDNLSFKPGEEERFCLSDSPAEINRKRKEKLQALLERRKKNHQQMMEKKKRKVHFLLPDELSIDDASEDASSAGSRHGEIGSASQSDISDKDMDEIKAEGDDTLLDERQNNEQDQSKYRNTGDTNLKDAVKCLVFDEKHKHRADRTNNWVARHTSFETRLRHGYETIGPKNKDISATQDIHRNQSEHPTIEQGLTPVWPATSSSFTSRLEKASCQTGEAGYKSESNMTLTKVNRLPVAKPTSPTHVNNHQFVVDGSIARGSDAVREIKFLSGRLPSIVISDN